MKSIGAEESLTGKVVEAVHGAIISGELAPGSLYSVNALAEQLAVSRTPVREAMIKLAAQGMVRFERSRGIRILQTSAQDLQEVFSLRLLLEVPAAARAAQQFNAVNRRELRATYAAMLAAAEADDEPTMMSHDRRFHALLLEGAGSPRLTKIVDELRDTVLLRGITTSPVRSLPEIVQEHEPVLAYVETGDPEGAARAMRDHLLRTATMLIAQESGAPETVAASFDWTSPTHC
jgi:DNA-binding GntR family transcriptional regulator